MADAARPVSDPQDQSEGSPVAKAMFYGPAAALLLAKAGEPRPQKAMEKAAEMRAQGASERAIYKATNKIVAGSEYTGISYDADGKPRFEASDANVKLKPYALDASRRGYLGEVLPRPETAGGAALPFEHRDAMPVEVDKMTGYHGDRITLKEKHASSFLGRTRLKDTARGPLLHEEQHVAQDVEGRASGGTPEDFERKFPGEKNAPVRERLYSMLKGEQEAELTRASADMTAEQRRAIHPDDRSYPNKVPRSEQLDVPGQGRTAAMVERKPETGFVPSPTKPATLAEPPKNVAQLKAEAKAAGIKGTSKMTKAALVQALGPSQPAPKGKTMALIEPPAAPSTFARAMAGYDNVNRVLGPLSIGVAAVGAYNRAWENDNATRREAMKEAGKAAAPGLALMALGAVSKTAGRAILPVMAAVQIGLGAKEDSGSALRRVRGAGRGLVRTLDPSAMFMTRGFGERGYDAVFGKIEHAEPGMWERLTGAKPKPADAPPSNAIDADTFKKANEAFEAKRQSGLSTFSGFEPPTSNQGYANPSVQRQLQLKRGVPEENITPWAKKGAK